MLREMKSQHFYRDWLSQVTQKFIMRDVWDARLTDIAYLCQINLQKDATTCSKNGKAAKKDKKEKPKGKVC